MKKIPTDFFGKRFSKIMEIPWNFLMKKFLRKIFYEKKFIGK